MSPMIIDLAILVILALFAVRGAKKGFILTIFSFAALFVAFFGARYVTDHFHKPVADIIRPSIELTVEELLHSSDAIPDDLVSEELPEGVTEEDLPDGDTVELPTLTDRITLDQILTWLDSVDSHPELRSLLREAIETGRLTVTTTAVDAVVAYLATLTAKIILFGLSFLLILLIWGLTSRALDLTFKLPILSWFNGVGGAVLGLVKGVAVMLVVVWLGKLTGLLEPSNLGPVTSLLTVEKLSALLRSVIAGTFTL